jgi:hypothetical protein
MKEAILKATKAGYKIPFLIANPNIKEDGIRIYLEQTLEKNSVLLDPYFWQFLGKYLGWKEFVWRTQWKLFICHLSDFGNVDKFFDDLCNTSPPPNLYIKSTPQKHD